MPPLKPLLQKFLRLHHDRIMVVTDYRTFFVLYTINTQRPYYLHYMYTSELLILIMYLDQTTPSYKNYHKISLLFHDGIEIIVYFLSEWFVSIFYNLMFCNIIIIITS